MSDDRKRLFSVAFTLFACFLCLIARFFQVQVLEHEKWKKQAFSQHQMMVSEPSRRGAFYSNASVKKGHPEEPSAFVFDVQKFHLWIDPKSIPESIKPLMAEKLFQGLGKLQEEGSFRLAKTSWHLFFEEFLKNSRARKLVSWLTYEERKALQQWWKPFAKEKRIPKNALFFEAQYQRSYPFGSMLGPVLHTVREDKDPKTGFHIPTGGLELFFQHYLEGTDGKKRVLRSLNRPMETFEVIQKAEDGADVYLTINHYLQAIVEAELAKGVENAKGKGGLAVMMEPFTGEILALAQTPGFDPSRYRDYFKDPQLQERTRIKALLDAFEPASVFKPITLAVCLKANEELEARGEAPLFSPEEKIATHNGWFPGRSFPLKDGRVHSFLNMPLAIQKSSNIYMGKLVEKLVNRMGDAWYRSALLELGFGQKTGVELPAETPGVVPTPGKLHPNGRLEWSLPTPYSLGIGHNILVNALQMIKVYGMFANGGLEVQPHLIRKMVKGNQVLLDNTGYRAHKQVLSQKNAQAIVRAMQFTTKEGGTSKLGDIMGYSEAGKSGTSEKILNGQYSHQKYLSFFVGLAPVHDPRFVLFVMVDEPELKYVPGYGKHHHGGVSASPIFREIGLKALQYLGEPPDDPYGYPYPDPRRNPKKAHWMNEVKALKERYETWNRSP